MTRYRLRLDQHEPAADGSHLLDWFDGPDRVRSTIAASGGLLDGIGPLPAALDILRLGAAVYCIDKVELRTFAADAWTRDIELEIPAKALRQLRAARPELTEALNFLTGDRWKLRLRQQAFQEPSETQVDHPDAICLFSGGLDSLAGAIDLLEDGLSVMLVGHFESGFVAGVQTALFDRLAEAYPDRVRLRQFQLGPAAPTGRQERPLPDQRERTTRARSFLFITAGMAVASAFGPRVRLYVPENGFIGINVPLVASRVSSLSTRTTHPYFIERLERALQAAGVTNSMMNPLRLMTKGEALANNRNGSLLASLATSSASCAHPESARWHGVRPSNCGYCFPCLIRRAALNRVGLDDPSSYWIDALSEDSLLQPESRRGADLRAVLRALARDPRPTDVLRNGRLSADDAEAYFDVYMRGREELVTWLRGGAGPSLGAALEASPR